MISIVGGKRREQCSVPFIHKAIIVQKIKNNNDGNRGIIIIILISRNSFLYLSVYIFVNILHLCVCRGKKAHLNVLIFFAVFSPRCLFLYEIQEVLETRSDQTR